MKCGKCQANGPDIDLAHVRACYAVELVGAGAQRAGGNGNQWRLDGEQVARPIRDAAAGTTANDQWRTSNQAGQRKVAGEQAIERFNQARRPSDWSEVNRLRAAIKPHLFERNKRQEGSFAVRLDGVVKFYQITTGRRGQWAGKIFVNVCASDDRHPVKSPDSLVAVLAAILKDVEGARKLYASELGHCYVCHKELTDEASRAAGIGPVCAGKYL